MRIGVPFLAVVAVLLAAPPAALAFDPGQEALNHWKLNERFAYEQADPAYQAELRSRTHEGFVFIAEERLRDSDRSRVTLCSTRVDSCSGDPRMFGWAAEGHGVSHDLQFVNRNGAVITAAVWAPPPDRYPGRLPGIVVTPGSIQAPKEHYLYIVQTLAQAGYVVITFDAQGQGRSDTTGEGESEARGVPSQQEPNFIEGTEEALDFLLSTPARPFVPRTLPGQAQPTTAQEKHARRVAAGLAAAFNPLHARVDASRIGIAGHSLGASAVSNVGQTDPRVDALVAWDNLGGPGDGVAITKPALGMSADYLLVPVPNVDDPERHARNRGFARYVAAGVDTMQVNIRGGGHFEFSYIPSPAFGATLRGIDMTAWYTTAWFDRYVKRDRTADRRLLSDRFRADPRGGEVDPQGDPNLFSFYYDSPVVLTRSDGRRVVCADLRPGCPELVPKALDGWPGEYSYLDARKHNPVARAAAAAERAAARRRAARRRAAAKRRATARRRAAAKRRAAARRHSARSRRQPDFAG